MFLLVETMSEKRQEKDISRLKIDIPSDDYRNGYGNFFLFVFLIKKLGFNS